jgi:hypothetical protein
MTNTAAIEDALGRLAALEVLAVHLMAEILNRFGDERRMAELMKNVENDLRGEILSAEFANQRVLEKALAAHFKFREMLRL